MERGFAVLAAVLGGIAAYFFWYGQKETAFIIGVLAAVSFFLSYRLQVRTRTQEVEFERRMEAEIEYLEESDLAEANIEIEHFQSKT